MLKPIKIIYNDPATVVFWDDGIKTVVRCEEGTTYDKHAGFCAAFTKRMYGSNSAIKSMIEKAENTARYSDKVVKKPCKCGCNRNKKLYGGRCPKMDPIEAAKIAAILDIGPDGPNIRTLHPSETVSDSSVASPNKHCSHMLVSCDPLDAIDKIIDNIPDDVIDKIFNEIFGR